ncbi:MAG TPA: hypothetical protein VHP99_01705, partial [Pyrinomonadaceae bacterium]|nr:hypothetical protein [Pyrinomonadaceae bacterium]
MKISALIRESAFVACVLVELSAVASSQTVAFRRQGDDISQPHAGQTSPESKTATSQSQPQNGAHRIRILRVSDPIKIDGHLDEPAWSQAEAATDFRQESPTEGAPASEKTEVRVLYDNKNAYIGIR